MNKQLQLKNTSYFARSKQQNLEELMRLTLINILNAKGVIYTYYKQHGSNELLIGGSLITAEVRPIKQERENNVHRQIQSRNKR